MIIATTISEVRNYSAEARSSGMKIGFVPTMGYLHEGHLRLVDIARETCGFTVMSIFINPIQFNVQADFDAYPREHDRDTAMARERGVDLLFLPDAAEMYDNRLTFVDMDLLTDNLCGAARPGHFRGVFTVVAKLFNIVQPDVAVFGQKDIQQALAISKMVDDLNFPVKVIVAPTVRENSGLAMSSRNKYLSPDERERALVIFRSLKKAEELITGGERRVPVITNAMKECIGEGAPLRIDYVSVVDYRSLAPLEKIESDAVIAVAVFFGMARLIDNMIIRAGEGGVSCVY